MAIAIGLHNIPEGFLVAMPIYFATGSKWKAFMWASMSGTPSPWSMHPAGDCFLHCLSRPLLPPKKEFFEDVVRDTNEIIQDQ
jgi:hypothetical protein